MKKTLSQDLLKFIACASMLLDHIGAVFLPWPWLRAIGRLAFPIYCFLLCQGYRHTRSLPRYLLRLGILALLAELPFDLLFYGKLTLAHQNVLFTLILGLLGAWAMDTAQPVWLKGAAGLLCILLAEALGTDYGGMGVLLILVMARTEGLLLWGLAMGILFASAGGMQIFGLLALIPIALCSGKKTGRGNRWMNWFYPAHLALLLVLDKCFP